MAGTLILVLSMVGVVVFAYLFGVGVGKSTKWIDGRTTKFIRDKVRDVSGRLAVGINDDYDLGYSEGFTDADTLRRADKQRDGLP